MDQAVKYSSCPLCFSGDFHDVLSCKDYTVSGELFKIMECSKCTLRFTQGIPGEHAIGPYYNALAYISHSDTGKGLIPFLYKAARRYTLGRKRQFMTQHTGLFTGNLLDVGSGTGSFLNEMKKNGWQVTGLEPDAGAREKARELYGISALETEALFKLPDGIYDVITMWHVLEHVHRLHENMNQMKKILKPGGKIFIAVPNYTCPDARHYLQYWAAYDVPRHLYHFSPDAMCKLADQHGFTVSKIKPMLLDSFYISMLSEQYQHGKSRLPAAFWHGFKTFAASLFNPIQSSSLIYVLENKG